MYINVVLFYVFVGPPQGTRAPTTPQGPAESDPRRAPPGPRIRGGPRAQGPGPRAQGRAQGPGPDARIRL